MPDLSAPITPEEAERVWKSQARPSTRTVATAMTRAGRPVHFTTVARWRRKGLLTAARARELRALAKLPPPVAPLEAKPVWDQQRRPKPWANSINRSLRILSRTRSCSANTVPGDQLGGRSYVCTLRDSDCYFFTGIPAGQCGKPQRGDGQEFRSWQALRIQLF